MAALHVRRGVCDLVISRLTIAPQANNARTILTTARCVMSNNHSAAMLCSGTQVIEMLAIQVLCYFVPYSVKVTKNRGKHLPMRERLASLRLFDQLSVDIDSSIVLTCRIY